MPAIRRTACRTCARIGARQPLTLAEVNRLAGTRWRNWSEVDPPRTFPRVAAGGARPYWQDPWTREWEMFRRHLVHLHYDELTQWLVEAGIPGERIWTGQGLMAPRGDAMSFAIDLDSPPRNYDTGGMTIAGAKPAQGHLGVILYGEAAVNDVPMDNGKSLFAPLPPSIRGGASSNTTRLTCATRRFRRRTRPRIAACGDVWNFGARFVSPMAWNGSNGASAGTPGYSTYTAWRNTPLEDAAREFMLARAGLPLGALLWTFGTPAHADGDGWTAEVGSLTLGKGFVTLGPDDNDRMVVLSPRGLPASAQNAEEFVLGLAPNAGLRRVRIQARRSPDSGWETIADANGAALRQTAAGFAIKRRAGPRSTPIDQFRIDITFIANTARTLSRIAAMTSQQ